MASLADDWTDQITIIKIPLPMHGHAMVADTNGNAVRFCRTVGGNTNMFKKGNHMMSVNNICIGAMDNVQGLADSGMPACERVDIDVHDYYYDHLLELEKLRADIKINGGTVPN